MIQINLLEEVVDNTAACIIETLTYVVAVGMSGLVCFIVSLSASQSLGIEQQSKMTLSSSLAKLEKVTKHIEDLQKKEETLAWRLTTIARLKTLQRIPILLLDEVTKVIPERAWLTEFIQKPGNINLKGIALDNQTISLFMNQLEQSVFTMDVQLLFSEQYEKDSIDLKRFEINVPLVDPLKARERLVQRKLREEQIEEGKNKNRETTEARKTKLQSMVIDNRTEEEKKRALAEDASAVREMEDDVAEIDNSRADRSLAMRDSSAQVSSENSSNSKHNLIKENGASDKKPLKKAVAGKIKVLKGQ